MEADDLLDSRPTSWVAYGNTYPHRETLTSWAWYWDAEHRCWRADHITDEDDPCLLAIQDLPGVTVERG